MGQAGMKNNWKRNTRYMGVFAVLAAVFCMIVVLNINTGNVQISVPEILRILFLKKGTQVQMNIIWKIRLPRVLMAGILGGALALSGFLLQTFFSNPIAGPYVLGISSGAKMMVALAMIIFLKYYTLVSSYILIIAAFIGSMLSIGFILLLARKIRNMATLLVGGIMIGYICSAVTDFVVTFAEDSDIVNLHGWSQGSFSGMSWSNVKVAALMVGITLILTFFLSKADRSVSAGGNVCAEYGGQYPCVPGASDSAFQCIFRMCDRICRTDFIRWNRSSVLDQASSRDSKTAGCDTGNIPWRGGVLYGM